MDQNNRTIQLVSIQHELAMSIGLDLNLSAMLEIFMSRMQRRLSLSAIQIFIRNPEIPLASCSDRPYMSFPQTLNDGAEQNWLNQQVADFYLTTELNITSLHFEQNHWYLLGIADIGVLAIQRKLVLIENMVLQALKPLLSRLALSCQACIEHQFLLDEIKARKKIEQQLTEQTYIDNLTGLPNRKMFNLNLEKMVAQALRENSFGAVLFIDVDRFKLINDTLGHGVGDELLVRVASLLKSCVRSGDTLARVGGDEFIIILAELGGNEIEVETTVSRIAQNMLNTTADALELKHCSVNVSLSIGICVFPVFNQHLGLNLKQHCNAAVKNADIAMYQVKRNSRNNYAFYRHELQVISDKRINIEKHLHIALGEQQFSLYYQPLVNQAGQIIAAEALLRWQSPDLGWVGPADFIPIAEESGLIVDISQWVVNEACRLIAKLEQQQVFGNLKYLSINVSPRYFSQPNFVAKLIDAVQQYQIDPAHLRLEITEGVALIDIANAIQTMQILREQGLFFMLDDFGNGYSSLSYLHKLPLQAVKIDRSFITDIHLSSNNRVIVNAMIDISSHFSLECIIEGLENQAEVDYFRDKPIAAIQGFHFYRPLPEADFVRLLI
jgi:diguanylate cyclase (GGDEF)-like protein